jgi:hypothetical protein
VTEKGGDHARNLQGVLLDHGSLVRLFLNWLDLTIIVGILSRVVHLNIGVFVIIFKSLEHLSELGSRHLCRNQFYQVLVTFECKFSGCVRTEEALHKLISVLGAAIFDQGQKLSFDFISSVKERALVALIILYENS